MTGMRPTRLGAVREYVRMTRPAGSVPELDGLRALAIVLVLLRHAVVPFRHADRPLLSVAGWDAATPLVNGWMGVDLFFVLSGFLITHHLCRRYGGALDRRTVGDYLMRRALRIVPAYYAVLVVVAAGLVPLYAVEQRDLGARVLGHLLFMQDYLAPDILVVFWSLGVEEKFYLVAPLLLAGVLCVRRPALQYAILAAVALLPTLFRAQTAAAFPGHFDYPLYFQLFRSGFHLSFDGLVLGMLCALVHRDRARWPWLEDPRVASVIFWMGAMIIGWLLAATPLTDDVSHFDKVYLGGSIAVGMSAMLLGLALGGGPRRWFQGYGAFVVSRLSYALYLTHYALIPAALAILDAALGSATPLACFVVFLPIYLALSFAAAAVLHYAVEKPFLALRDHGFRMRLPSCAAHVLLCTLAEPARWSSSGRLGRRRSSSPLNALLGWSRAPIVPGHDPPHERVE